MNDIEEILNDRENYVAGGMSKFNLDGQEYTGFSDYTFAWELSYVTSPERSQSGAMGDLDTTYPAFLTPHVTITYSLMTIDDYRRFKQQLNNKRQFTGVFYDVEYDRTIAKQVYVATPSMPKLRTITNDDGTVSLIGVDNYTIELIGTNNDNN